VRMFAGEDRAEDGARWLRGATVIFKLCTP
jgi:hypothetical protein